MTLRIINILMKIKSYLDFVSVSMIQEHAWEKIVNVTYSRCLVIVLEKFGFFFNRVL